MTFTRLMARAFRNQAFTLIELLIVILVISVLIGIAVPRMQGIRDEANQVKASAETRALGAAIEAYYLQQTPKSYPSSTSSICNDVLNKAKPLIINEVLYDPFLQVPTEYNYILSDDSRYYVVFSVGLDGTADITGIDDDGEIQGVKDDDIYWTNGTRF